MFDINNNLFGYISTSTEMSTNITQRYKNSLIFIGDEKQIYIPTTNSYVGIGLSYFNQVLNERTSNADKIYIENIANDGQVNSNTTYYFPVISGTTPNTYYYTYVALNVGVDPVGGKFIGNLKGTADYSTVSHVTYKNTVKSTNTNSTYYISFTNQLSGDSYTYVNSNLQYNPNTKTLTVNNITTTNIVGDIEGTANYSKVSNLTYQILVNSTNTDSSYYLPFVNKIGEGSYAYANTHLEYNPKEETLKSTYFSGYLLGWASYASYATHSTYTTYTTYALFNSYQSVHLLNNQTNKTFNVIFGLNSSYSLSYIDNSFNYNTKTQTLTVPNIVGKIFGNVFIEQISNDVNYPLVFTEANVDNGTYALYKNYASILYNPYRRSLAIGNMASATGLNSVAEGYSTIASGSNSHAEGINTTAGPYAHAEGSSTIASGDTSHAEGYLSEAQGQFSHAEGQNVRAKNTCSHAEGINTEAGPYSHAEGSATHATGDTSHTEGYNTTASAQFSHAEGNTNTASGWCSHVGGNGSTSSGDQSFAHGNNTISSGWCSFATNANTLASGFCSFACGQDTIASHNYEFASGHYNASNSDTIFSIGGGNSNNNRFNLLEVTTSGLIKGKAGFNKVGYDDDNVLLAGGGHKSWSESNTSFALVARNSSGNIYVNDINTQADNFDSTAFTKVYVSNDDWIKYVTKSTFAAALRDEDTVSINKTLKVTEAWMDTGITTGTSTNTINKGNGTYAIQISHNDLGGDGKKSIYSGIITIFDGTNGTESEEVILHRGGIGTTKRLYIKLIQVTNSSNQGHAKIQIAASSNWDASHDLTFKFRKLI